MANKTDRRLKDKRCFETTSSRSGCKIHHGVTYLTTTTPFGSTYLTFCSVIASFVDLYRLQQSGHLPSTHDPCRVGLQGTTSSLIHRFFSCTQEIRSLLHLFSFELFLKFMLVASVLDALAAVKDGSKTNHLLLLTTTNLTRTEADLLAIPVDEPKGKY